MIVVSVDTNAFLFLSFSTSTTQKAPPISQIPFNDFTYTRRGEHFEENTDEFYRDRVSMIGISVLGGNAGLEGPYELGIDEIWATNEELSPAKVRSPTPAPAPPFSRVSDPDP